MASRLFLAIGLILLAGGIIVTSAALAYGHQAARDAFDRLLVGAANQISASISIVDGTPLVDLPVTALELLALAREDRIAYRVIDPEGVTLTGYDELALPPTQQDVSFFDGTFAGAPVRLVAVRRHFAERGFSGTVTTIVAHTTIARQALAWDIARNAWMMLAVAGIGMVALAAFSIRSALVPLKRIGQDLLRRDPKDLTPLDIVVPRELRAVVDAINRFITRLHQQIDGMQNLISDSAHQLRTPIAALRAQAQLASEEQDPARQSEIVGRILARAVGLSRLTDQMLNRALVIHRGDSAVHTRIDLRRTAMAAAEVFDDGAIFEVGRLRLDLSETPVWIAGDALSLEEAVKNLISNALQHGDGVVTVSVIRQPDEALLHVHDEGKGMTAKEARQLGQRFLSSDQHRTNGTGIGLSIAHAVANAHGATIEVDIASNSGFTISLVIPLQLQEHSP
ncbi:sensor histidine kinase [Devosia rhodophyticola]|uniref:histidine kinase n=1 Tax=Devosia rhodophyticola TaxID=3026423 RepID=A0ABY7Z0G2_9HYPH|nr:sensor histidine kinase [Devosia rhodophyticola]WDR06949.1 sensor histidine kinase [Devosia rhodophyticola]